MEDSSQLARGRVSRWRAAGNDFTGSGQKHPVQIRHTGRSMSCGPQPGTECLNGGNTLNEPEAAGGAYLVEGESARRPGRGWKGRARLRTK